MSRGVRYTDSFLIRKLDATALRRGGSRSQLNSSKREAPRCEPVASAAMALDSGLATNVRFHGTSPWHLFDC